MTRVLQTNLCLTLSLSKQKPVIPSLSSMLENARTHPMVAWKISSMLQSNQSTTRFWGNLMHFSFSGQRICYPTKIQILISLKYMRIFRLFLLPMKIFGCNRLNLSWLTSWIILQQTGSQRIFKKCETRCRWWTSLKITTYLKSRI